MPLSVIGHRGVMHSLFLRGQELGGGGGGVIMWHTSATKALMFYLFIFLFIWNIPKRMNYIMKYLDSHLYRLC